MFNRNARIIVGTIIGCGIIGSVASECRGSDPTYVLVSYDAPKAVACIEVSRTERSKIIVVEIPVSAYCKGSDTRPSEIELEFVDPNQKMRVVDFIPRNTFVSDIAGAITIRESKQRSGETAFAFHIDPRSELRGSIGPTEGGLTVEPGDAGGEVRSTTLFVTGKEYKQLPPREQVVASGTRNREHGAFFKLKESSQIKLEGQHSILCLMEVGLDWRCGTLNAEFGPVHVSPHDGGRHDNELQRNGIVLYIRDDKEAKEAAEHAFEQVELYNRDVLPKLAEVQRIESSYLYPWFGYGSQAQSLREEVAALTPEYEVAMEKFSAMNSGPSPDSRVISAVPSETD